MRIQLIRSESVTGGSSQGPAEVCATEAEECRLDWPSSVDAETIEERVSACGMSDPYALSNGTAPIVIRDFACSGWESFFDLMLDLQEACDSHDRLCREGLERAIHTICVEYPGLCTDSTERFLTLSDCASEWGN